MSDIPESVTEDVLQETWLSWTARITGSPLDGITNPRAYLVRIAVNHALARRAAISRRQETYVGPWLPEPLVAEGEEAGADDPALRTESVSLAMLVVLESVQRPPRMHMPTRSPPAPSPTGTWASRRGWSASCRAGRSPWGATRWSSGW